MVFSFTSIGDIDYGATRRPLMMRTGPWMAKAYIYSMYLKQIHMIIEYEFYDRSLVYHFGVINGTDTALMGSLSSLVCGDRVISSTIAGEGGVILPLSLPTVIVSFCDTLSCCRM
jgi:hypothetical protein